MSRASKIRARLVNDLSKTLIEHLNQKQEIIKLKQLGEVALENQRILNTPIPCFMYMSNRYTYPYNLLLPTGIKGIPRTLHHSLMDKVIKILEVSFDDKINNSHIINLINESIQISNTISCLRKILPVGLWHYNKIPIDKLEDIYNIGDVLTDDNIKTFKEKNKLGFNAIKIMCMLEILLGG